MESALATLSQAARIASDLVKYIAFQLGYELDTTTIASTFLSLIALYFTLLTIYRTTAYAIRTVYWLAKWAFILYIIGGSIGFLMTSGQRGFTLQPVFEALFAYALKNLGWGALPDVAVGGGPNGRTIQVNGIPLELPADYHQYGDAWNKFKSRSSSSKKKSSKKSAGVFDSFNSKSNTKKKGKGAAVAAGAGGGAAAMIAQRFLGDGFDYDAAAEAMQSVEAIQKGVSDSFEAVKRAVLGGGDAGPESPPPADGWKSWWPFASSDDDDQNHSR